MDGGPELEKPSSSAGRKEEQLGQNTVPETAVSKCPGQLLRVKLVRESECNPAGLVKHPYLVRRERQVEAPEIVLQLRKPSRTDDGNDRDWPVAEPCKRHLGHAAAELIGHGLDRRD